MKLSLTTARNPSQPGSRSSTSTATHPPSTLFANLLLILLAELPPEFFASFCILRTDKVYHDWGLLTPQIVRNTWRTWLRDVRCNSSQVQSSNYYLREDSVLFQAQLGKVWVHQSILSLFCIPCIYLPKKFTQYTMCSDQCELLVLVCTDTGSSDSFRP